MTPPLDIRFAVPGIPVPKGNHDAFPIARGRCVACKPGAPCRRRNCFGGTIVGTVVTDSKGGELEAWQQHIKILAMSARNAAGARLVDTPGAIEVRMVFMLERPAGHLTTRGALSADGERRPFPSVKPDWDKLARAVADGLTGAVATDDAQIVIAMVGKVYAARAGVLVRARVISEPEPWVLHELAAAGVVTTHMAQGALL